MGTLEIAFGEMRGHVLCLLPAKPKLSNNPEPGPQNKLTLLYLTELMCVPCSIVIGTPARRTVPPRDDMDQIFKDSRLGGITR